MRRKMRNEIQNGLVETKTNGLEPNSIWDKQISSPSAQETINSMLLLMDSEFRRGKWCQKRSEFECSAFNLSVFIHLFAK